MAEENHILGQKLVKPEFVNEAEVPTLFVNVLNVRAGSEEFYLTFGTALPIEVRHIEELEDVDTVKVQPLFRCAVTKSAMRQMIDLMENIYNQQQLGASGQSQENESEGR
ncbi:MAG TPA: hypothetical protein VFB60_18670 [Ktedonobacteraceae bacterium]|nr:hypothetical protein [Ktedonobacteraceae bacterium]